MKNTNRCPKCGSSNIAVPRPSIAPSGSGVWLTIPTGMMKAALARPYICCDCGFTEYWIEDYNQLKDVERKYRG